MNDYFCNYIICRTPPLIYADDYEALLLGWQPLPQHPGKWACTECAQRQDVIDEAIRSLIDNTFARRLVAAINQIRTPSSQDEK